MTDHESVVSLRQFCHTAHMYGAGKERKLLEVKVNSFLGRFRTAQV